MSNAVKFIATEVGGEVLDNVLITGAAELYGTYVVFQRGLLESTGSGDPPYFEYGDQSQGGYGVLNLCTLSANLLEIEINSGKLNLKGVERIEVTLNINDGEWSDFKSKLIQVFKGYENLFEVINT